MAFDKIRKDVDAKIDPAWREQYGEEAWKEAMPQAGLSHPGKGLLPPPVRLRPRQPFP